MLSFRLLYSCMLICGILCSCQQNAKKEASEGKTLIIDIPELSSYNDPIKITEVFNIVKSIKLETDSTNIISGEIIPKINEYKGDIYFLDLNIQAGLNPALGNIYRYNGNGKLYGQIGHKGKGPGEYLSTYYFNIWKDIVLIVDETIGKLVFYSLTGKFIKEIKPDFRFYRCDLLDDNSYFFWLNNYNKKVDNKDFEIIMCDSMLKKPIGIINEDNNTDLISNTSFIVFDSLLYFNRYFTNTIYSIDKKGNVSKAYVFNYNSRNTIPEDLMKEDVTLIERERKEKNYAKIYRFHILKDYLYVELIAKEKYILLVSKKTGKIKIVNSGKIINNVNETGATLNISGSVNESNTLIGYVSAHNVVDNAKNPETKITSLSEKIYEEDNPVIVYYKIVDF